MFSTSCLSLTAQTTESMEKLTTMFVFKSETSFQPFSTKTSLRPSLPWKTGQSGWGAGTSVGMWFPDAETPSRALGTLCVPAGLSLTALGPGWSSLTHLLPATGGINQSGNCLVHESSSSTPECRPTAITLQCCVTEPSYKPTEGRLLQIPLLVF